MPYNGQTVQQSELVFGVRSESFCRQQNCAAKRDSVVGKIKIIRLCECMVEHETNLRTRQQLLGISLVTDCAELFDQSECFLPAEICVVARDDIDVYSAQ